MRTGNSQRYEQWDDEAYATDNVIYLYEQRNPRKKKNTRRSDTVWNLVFVGACLSVLVVLFLH